jgi:large conductance mechanosensitive channel
MKIIQEFKDFAVKGNAIDLAVGVVVGAAFSKIVTSLVEDIINPLIGLFVGKIDLSQKVFALSLPIEGSTQLVLRYGSFITALINFTIIAFVIFLFVKQINRFKKEEVAKEPKISDEVVLLTQIRDSLANK